MTELSSPVPFLVYTTVRQQVALLICVLGCGYAIWRGGRPEKIFGWVLLTGWAFSPFLVNTRNWFDPQWAEAAVDLVVLGVLLWLAFTSDRYWPMWCAAFDAVGVLMHVTMLVDRRVPPWSYRMASAIWSYVVLITLVAGTAVEARRRLGPVGAIPRQWRIWRFGRS